MASPLPQLVGQDEERELVNAAGEAVSHILTYAKADLTTSGLDWGYYGGRWGGVSIAAAVITLGATTTTYLVVERATGTLTASTSTTNWNDATNYARVYKLTTNASVVTAEEDHRGGPGGVHFGDGGGGGSGTVTHTAGALTASAIMVGNGTDDAKVLASLGSTTTLLHGNAAGLPTFGAVSLTADVTGALPVANGGTASTSASAARTALGLVIGTDVPGVSQATEAFSFFIETPTNKSYKLLVKVPHGGTITELTTISESGTCTLTGKINTTALGGTANSVSSSEQSQAHASANVFSAGDDWVFTVSSNSGCLGLTITGKYTRTLA